MSCSLSLNRFCEHRQDFGRRRRWPAAIIATVGCLTFLNLALAQEPSPVSQQAAAKAQSANEPQQSPVREQDKLLAEHKRLLDEENKYAEAGKYAEAIKTSQQREQVLLEQAKLPDLKQAANQTRLDLLELRASWQWLSGTVTDAVKTAEQRLQFTEQEFGAEHWQMASARFALDYYRKVVATDEPTRMRIRELEQQADAASDQADYPTAIAKSIALQDIEARVLGVDHPSYANRYWRKPVPVTKHCYASICKAATMVRTH